jgi:hypothetical protein
MFGARLVSRCCRCTYYMVLLSLFMALLSALLGRLFQPWLH